MHIQPLQPEHIPAAADLFSAGYARQLAAQPLLPAVYADSSTVSERIANLAERCPSFVAIDAGQVVGYLGGWLIDHFRDTPRRAAYVPEWAHAVQAGRETALYAALYRAASTAWFDARCDTHAISLLAADTAAREAWFWNGFGLMVVDALRSTGPIPTRAAQGYTIRAAELSEVDALAEIEAEHWQHYLRPPVLMTPQHADDANAFRAFLTGPENSAWTAWRGAELAGYIRFEGSGFGAADIVNAPDTIAITGAYVRPAHRKYGLATAILDAALADYRTRGFHRCSVDFESFNPEAAAFWRRYFDPVVFSLMRVPERHPS